MLFTLFHHAKIEYNRDKNIISSEKTDHIAPSVFVPVSFADGGTPVLFCYSSCNGVGCGPCGLEVETTRDAVDVENLTGKVEMGRGEGFECVFVDSVEGNASAGDEFVFVVTTGDNAVLVVCECFDDAIEGFLAYVANTFAVKLYLVQEVLPQTGVEVVGMDVVDESFV